MSVHGGGGLPGAHLTEYCRRGPIDPAPPEPGPCVQLLAYLGRWKEPPTEYGRDVVDAWLGQVCGESRKVVVVHRVWRPAYGYSAAGCETLLAPLAFAPSLGGEPEVVR